MTKLKLHVIPTLLGVLLLAGCVTSAEPGPEERALPLLPGDTPVMHAVHSDRLRATMYALEQLTLGDLPEGLEFDEASSARRNEILELAGTLAEAAAALPGMLATFELPEESAPRFYELADQLRQEALALESRAAAGDLGSAHDETEKLLVTCNSCHAEMRIMPATSGEPDR